jgi:NADPH:quinone reductase
MRALVVDHTAPGHLRLGEVPDPRPGPGQALIAVEAISLNHGELPGDGSPEGHVPGWDAAGTLVEPGGTGLPVGSRVVSQAAEGGWAERRVAEAADVAVLPDRVSFAQAAALPVAGVTALRALRAVGAIVGRRVLVTGASGGVGRFAVQLARRAGAQVIAVSRSSDRAAGLREIGADEIVFGVDAAIAPVHAVLETAGGATLVGAFGLLEAGGVLISIGAASGEPSVFPPYSTIGPPRTLMSFIMGPAVGGDLAYLARLVAAGELDPQIGWQGNWSQAGEAAEALLSGRVQGKAILVLN